MNVDHAKPAAVDPQIKPTDLGCKSAPAVGCYRLHPPLPFYYYSSRKLILILPPHAKIRLVEAPYGLREDTEDPVVKVTEQKQVYQMAYTKQRLLHHVKYETFDILDVLFIAFLSVVLAVVGE